MSGQEKRKPKLHSLTNQISVMLAGALIPIIILSIALSGMLVETMQEELYTAYRTELRLYMQAFENNRDILNAELNQAISDNWNYFAGISDDPQMERLTLFSRIREICDAHQEFARCTFVIDYSGPETEVMLSYDDVLYSYAESLEIKKHLQKLGAGELSSRRCEPVVIGGNPFLMYPIVNYKQTLAIGYLSRVADILPKTEQEEGSTTILQWNDGRGFAPDTSADPVLLGEAVFNQTVRGKKNSYISVASGDGEYAFLKIADRSRIFHQVPALQRSLQFVAFLMILLIPVVWYFMRKRVLEPLGRLRRAMQEVENDHIDFRMEEENTSRDFRYLQQEFNSMAGEIQNLRIQAYEREIEKLQVEADNIRLQVSPHMLMNSLNMIYNLSLSKNNKVIQQFTLCLSDYFRYSLKNHEETVPLKEELQFVENYVNVQKVRFPGKFVYVYDIEEETMGVRIPPLLIQNFVENTIKYGLKMDSEIEIILTVKADAEKVYISIVDTGAGMTMETLEHLRSGESYEDDNGTHIGIRNCRRRLHMLYGDAVVLNMTSAPGEGTQVYIEIPNRDMQTAGNAAGQECIPQERGA